MNMISMIKQNQTHRQQMISVEHKNMNTVDRIHRSEQRRRSPRHSHTCKCRRTGTLDTNRVRTRWKMDTRRRAKRLCDLDMHHRTMTRYAHWHRR